MVRLLIIADDLTGACDTGVQLSKQGVGTVVTCDREVDPASFGPDVSVVAVNVESRHIRPAEAAARVTEVVRRASAASVTHFFKKTDSTLRGNIGAELEAAIAAAGRNRLMFVPAYPAAHRFTRGGRQYVGTVPVHKTPFAADPREPIETSHIPSIIAAQCEMETAVVSADPDGVAAALQGPATGIFIFDCNGDDDLSRIARTLADHGALELVAGCGGFAEFLPDVLNLPRGAVPRGRGRGPMLVVSGSLHEASLRQAAFGIRNGFAEIVVPPSVLLADPAPPVEVQRLANETAAASKHARDVIIRSIVRREELDRYLKESGAGTAGPGGVFALAAANMGRLAARAFQEGAFAHCVIFGGDTAMGVLGALGSSSFRLGGEILPGLALGKLEGAFGSLDLITKAGGFGEEDVLCRIRDSLKQADSACSE